MTVVCIERKADVKNWEQREAAKNAGALQLRWPVIDGWLARAAEEGGKM